MCRYVYKVTLTVKYMDSIYFRGNSRKAASKQIYSVKFLLLKDSSASSFAFRYLFEKLVSR